MIKIAILILFIFNILACKPMQQVSERENAQQQQAFSCLTSQSQCDISTDFGEFTIEFSGEINQGRIKTELPFQIQLRFDDKEKLSKLTKVTSYLEGKSMFMGKVPVFFQFNEKSEKLMVAETLLASCSEEVMTWRLWLQLEVTEEGEARQQSLFIDFDSERL